MKKFEYKYMNEAFEAEINGLWAEHGEALEAFAKDSVEAWKSGYKYGFFKTGCASILLAGVIGAGAVTTYFGTKLVDKYFDKKTKELEESKEK